MYRNSYNPSASFSQTHQSRIRGTSSSGFGARASLYPIGPTLAQPEFQGIQRGFSPSPYLNKAGIRPPSYETRYLTRTDGFTANPINYEERERSLILRNEKEIEEEERRREQLRLSY